MTQDDLYRFLSVHTLAVQASVTKKGAPQAALVGIAVNQALELVFDTLNTTRKYRNLVANPDIALVMGWDAEATLQYEGEASELQGEELERYKQVYFASWPECREHEQWPGIAYFKVRPRWIRFSDYTLGSSHIEEFRF